MRELHETGVPPAVNPLDDDELRAELALLVIRTEQEAAAEQSEVRVVEAAPAPRLERAAAVAATEQMDMLDSVDLVWATESDLGM